MKIIAPISVAELLDKISILQIKSQHTDNLHVSKELKSLTEIAKENKVYNQEFLSQLLEVNSKLWMIENKIREFEKNQIFDEEFIRNARLVYNINDKRSRIKKGIDECTNSEFRETKIYTY